MITKLDREIADSHAVLERLWADAREAFLSLSDESRDRLVDSVVPGRSLDGLTETHQAVVAHLARLSLQQIMLDLADE